MRLLTFRTKGKARLGLLVKDKIIDVANAYQRLFEEIAPSDAISFLEEGSEGMEKANKLEVAAKTKIRKSTLDRIVKAAQNHTRTNGR